jgi:hypothetical protein
METLLVLGMAALGVCVTCALLGFVNWTLEGFR